MASPSDHFRQTITAALVTGRDAYGKPTLGAQSSYPARVQPMQRNFKDAHGHEFISTHLIYTAASIGLNHRIWLPGEDTGDTNKARRVSQVEQHVDGAGVVRYRTLIIGGG